MLRRDLLCGLMSRAAVRDGAGCAKFRPVTTLMVRLGLASATLMPLMVSCEEPGLLDLGSGSGTIGLCVLADRPCTSSDGCPMGTHCAPPYGRGFACENTDNEKDGGEDAGADAHERDAGMTYHCAPDASSPDSTALLAGIARASPETRLSRLEVTRGEDGTFHYESSSNATSVTCALFVCDPEVILTNGRWIIDNFRRCVLTWNNIAGKTGVFDPKSDLYSGYRLRRCQDYAGPLYGTLSVGCWAYSDDAVVAVSELSNLDADALANVAGNGSVLGCEGRRDGSDCVLDDTTSALGTCSSNHCEERCVTTTDCQVKHFGETAEGHAGAARSATTRDPRDAASDAVPDGAAMVDGSVGGSTAPGARTSRCDWYCDSVSGSTVGVCRRTP